MSDLLEVARMVLARALALWADPRILGSAVTLGLVLLSVLVWRHGRDWWRHLLGRGARVDAVYSVFYVGGFYAFLVSGPLFRLLAGLVDRHAPFLKLNLVAGLPAALQFVVASVVLDGVLYWAHRWAHANRWLWVFHSVHHSQQELTPLANYRFHFVDVTVKGLLQFPAALLLGVPAGVWVAVVWAQVALDGLAHSGLAWGYGPLGRVLISPGFHRVHHSAEARHQSANFGLSYSFWDRLFGTEARSLERPESYGVPELAIPESFARQLAFPFMLLARSHSDRGWRGGARPRSFGG